MTERARRLELFREAAAERILLLEGAMGTMIQGYELTEEDFRGTRFRDHPCDLKGNNDLLNISRPDVIRDIHQRFMAAGSEIVETNTFSSTRIAQADYQLEDLVYELNLEGAKLSRELADEWTAEDPSRPRFVVGNLGPTNRTCSISPDVNDPGFRNTSFDEMKDAYKEQARGLVDGGVDFLIVETVFDTLNCKAAIFGIRELEDETGEAIPLMVSGTITDLSGRNLSGQTVGAFWASIRHANPAAVGLNCGFGADQLRPYVEEFSSIADVPIIAYPNAGLPNEMGEYDESPEAMAAQLRDWGESGFLNIVGGCCGTRPEHIEAIAAIVRDLKPRAIPEIERRMRLSGLEVFTAS